MGLQLLILEFETSCDETSVELFGDALIGQVIRSQKVASTLWWCGSRDRSRSY